MLPLCGVDVDYLDDLEKSLKVYISGGLLLR